MARPDLIQSTPQATRGAFKIVLAGVAPRHREWLILPETWKTEICAGYDSVATARALADRGVLNPDPAGKFQRSERTPYGSKRVYVVTSEILEGSDHAQ